MTEEIQIIVKRFGIIIFMFIVGFVSAKLLMLTFDLMEKDKQINELQQKYTNITSEYNEIHKNIGVLLSE